MQTSNNEGGGWPLGALGGGDNHPPGFGLSMIALGSFPTFADSQAPTPLSTLSRWQMGTSTVACRRPDDLASCVVLCTGTLPHR